MDTLQSKIAAARRDVSYIQAEISDAKSKTQADGDVSEATLNKLQSLVKKLPKWASTIKALDTIPGLRTPKWYTVDIPFEYGDTLDKSNEIIISAEGPFVCTQVQTYFLVTDTDTAHYPLVPRPLLNGVPPASGTTGRILPCSTYDALLQNLMFTHFLNMFSTYSSYNETVGGLLRRGYGWNYPEFDFKINIEGSGRFWAGSRVPAPAFYGFSNPLYLGFPGVVENTDRIVVTAYPTTGTVNLQGVVRMVFHGYQIRGNFNIARELGYF
jgi:hypothetical protein